MRSNCLVSAKMQNSEIVDYGSRDLLAIRIDGRTITDPDEIEAVIKQYEELEM